MVVIRKDHVKAEGVTSKLAHERVKYINEKFPDISAEVLASVSGPKQILTLYRGLKSMDAFMDFFLKLLKEQSYKDLIAKTAKNLGKDEDELMSYYESSTETNFYYEMTDIT